jgi:AcrR family transcriptional regulator
MSQQVQNVRLKRTQKLLQEALIELIEERGFDALTIGELTERAMVSRAAFYRNYRFFKSCRGKRMFFDLVLGHHRAMF